jgi:alkane 1-monooxygenase
MKHNAWKYTLPFCMYMAAWISFTSLGIAAWLPVIIGFAIIPMAELLIPADRANLSEKAELVAKSDRSYDYFLYLFVVLQYLALFMFLHSMEDTGLALNDRLGRIVSMGILCGTFGINIGHELGHRVSRSEQWLARLSLLSSLYMHFMIEHNKGHHKYVATEQDPTSARYGENIYGFWLRSMTGTFASAWRIAKREEPKLIKNEMIWMQVGHIIFCLVMALLFGWAVMGYFIAAALIGILLLNTVNYIEHYGLVRKRSGESSFERAMPEHSWNSNHVVGRIMLFELSRHSDHHYLASRKYQLLRHHDASPELPTGYPGSMLLTLVPPLWFKVMHRKMKIYQEA